MGTSRSLGGGGGPPREICAAFTIARQRAGNALGGGRSSQWVNWIVVMANLSQRQSMRWDTLRAGFASVGGGDIEDARFRLHCIGRALAARLRAGARPAGAARGSAACPVQLDGAVFRSLIRDCDGLEQA